MNDSLGTFNTFALLILGASVLWTVRLVYGTRGRTADDALRRLLSITAWLLMITGSLGVLTGLLGWVSVPFWFLLICILLMSLGKYQDAERRALLWTVAVAAERGIPLASAVRAFADERSFSLRTPVARLARLLEQGVPLPEALHRSRNPLPLDAQLAAQLGTATGQLGPALRQVMRHVDVVDVTFRALIEKLLYVLLVLILGGALLTFYAIVIAPRYQTTVAAFNVTVPGVTATLFTLGDQVARYWWLLIPVFLLLIGLGLVFLLYYIGWLNYNLPLLGWVWARYDSGLVMRCLALTVSQRRAMPETLAMLSREFPRRRTRRQLRRAVGHVNNGLHWCESLRRAGLLRSYEAAVLRSAEQVGNLPWALDEMADSCLRRIAFRFRTMFQWLVPPLFLLLGAGLAFIAAGLLLPLVELIHAVG